MKPGLRYFSTAMVILFSQALLANQPNRIVSLDLCTDWMLHRYAKSDVDITFSPYLYQFENDRIDIGLPTHNGSLEQVLSLKPDLVIAGEFNALLLRQRLQQLGVRVEVLKNPQRLGDVVDYIESMKQLIGVDISSSAVASSASPATQNQRLLMLGANGVAAGRDTLENDIIQAAGWDNYVSQSGFVALDLEALIIDPPTAVFSANARGRSLALRFADHPALRQRISAADWRNQNSWRWTCPGPWTFDLIQELAEWNAP